ncbi:MAG: heavy-metal-associated domain-containing protein [Planctomycetia bacterium]|nr:heavy-metal-associated domain-containing protein [Planctomycetia bacterium]
MPFAKVRGLLLLAAVLTAVGVSRAADAGPTTIKVESIHCQGCAKRIVTKLSAVPGVAKVQTDFKAATTLISPRSDATLSPKALWEAMEASGHKPVKLQGPAGTFTEKPAS